MRLIAWMCGCLLIVACSGGSPGMSADGGGSGGQNGSGTGGSAGTGGTTGGTGGAMTGSGGTVGGTGGNTTGTGGTAGKDGGTNTDTGADAGAVCAEIEAMYGIAFKAAQSCNPRSANQCQKSAAGSLTPCSSGCLTSVNDDTQLNKLKQEWVQAQCDSQRPVVCPNIGIVCLPPQGACVPAADDAGGLCGNAR